MHPDDAVGVRRGAGDRGDRERGRVGGEDRVAGDDVLEGAKERLLHRQVLDDGLDDDTALAVRVEVARGALGALDAREDLVGARLIEPPLDDVAREGGADRVVRDVNRALLRVAHDDAMARHGGHLCDTPAHRAGADDADGDWRVRHVNGRRTAACASRRRRARLP